MKRSSLYTKVVALALVCAMGGAVVGCGKKEETTTTAPSSIEVTSETTPVESATTTTESTTLMEYGESLAPNDIQVTWQEDAMDPKVMYIVGVENYLKVRKGPDTKYDQVGSLTKGMQVIVVAKTNNNWYKLQDGYYVSADYVSLTAS
ncbi:MAG: SH3 domain-containing protein [Lachnospiraceae bacterium]|nr:SH3 domain-containing protein [Clostridiales bacterium]MBR6849629.1 SH3 domain-containing protein [Lachnospiraceae bacterium]MCR5057571.1 SH3 domain-containing protein [Clostridiales bacterium]